MIQDQLKKKSVALLYTNDKEAEKEIRETLPFTIAINNIKYFGVIVTKLEKNLFDKNFKTLKKEIEEDQKMERSPMLLGR